MTEEPTTKAELLALIGVRWQVLQDMIGRLNEAQMEQPLGDGWSAKQHVAHLAAWEKSLMGLLRKQDRGKAMGLPAAIWASHDEEAINAWLADQVAGKTPGTAIEEARTTHAELISLLESVTQEQLEMPYSTYQLSDTEPNNNPVVGWVHGNTWDHYNEHIGWLEQGLAQAAD